MIDKELYANKQAYTLEDLVSIMKILREKGTGCPWDAEQDHRSIRNSLIEETYEAVEGIDKGDDALLCEELGDVLLQVVFHAEIASSEGSFDINDVATGICKKLVLRHPHVFGDVTVGGSAEVLDNWDKIKKEEKHRKTLHTDLEEVAKTLPSLIRVQKLRKKCEKAGVISTSTESACRELCAGVEAIRTEGTSPEAVAELLCAVSDIARAASIDAEQALYNKCEQIIEAGSLE